MQAKLRVAVVTTYPPSLGSLNEYAFHFIRYLRIKPEVAEVIILGDELPPGQEYDPDVDALPGSVPMTIDPVWRFGAWDNTLRLWSAIRRHKPDVVLFNIQFASFGSGKVPATLGLLSPALFRLTGVPTIVLLHNIMETVDLKNAGFAGNQLMEALIRGVGTVVTRIVLMADRVAVTIPKYVETLEAKYKMDNVLLAPHGAFASTPPPTFDESEEGQNRPFQVMAFGKFGTYKKVELMIEACQLLRQQDDMPELEVVIAGTNSPNAEGYLEGVAETYADVPNIRYTGYVAEEDVPVIFTEASVVVFPYTSTTGSSGVLHQAGEYGRPVVLPNIDDFAEVITEEGYTGEFFQPGDVQSMADALERLIREPDRRREIGTQNYMAASGLPISDVVDWYIIHFQELLKE